MMQSQASTPQRRWSTTMQRRLARGPWAGVDWPALMHAYRVCEPEELEAFLAALAMKVTGVSASPETPPRPRVLMSACLLGCRTSYRGASAACLRTPLTSARLPVLFVKNVLAERLRLIECVPQCPEMGVLGLGAPRPPVRLVRGEGNDDAETQRLVAAATGEELLRFRQDDPQLWGRLVSLKRERRGAENTSAPDVYKDPPLDLSTIDAVLLKAQSPSCGVGDARLYAAAGGGGHVFTDGFYCRAVQTEAPGLCITSERLLKFFCADDLEEMAAAAERRAVKERRLRRRLARQQNTAPEEISVADDDPRLPVVVGSPQTCLTQFLDAALTSFERRRTQEGGD